jgi:hypothetical protein
MNKPMPWNPKRPSRLSALIKYAAAGIALVAMLAAFGWYFRYIGVKLDYGAVARINRFTGEVDIFDMHGQLIGCYPWDPVKLGLADPVK